MPSENDDSESENQKSPWASTGITGLVRDRRSGIYYHRYSLNGKRTYRSLKTKRFPTAKRNLAQKAEAIESMRMANKTNDDLRTLGDLKTLLLQRVSDSERAESTKENYEVWFGRVASVWPNFENVLADRVDGQTLLDVRTKLQNFKFRKGRGFSKTVTVGYKPGAVNQALLVVKLMLDLAHEKGIIFKNPFEEKNLVGARIFLPRISKKPVLPTRADMDRIFADMASPPAHSRPVMQEWHEWHAGNAAEMARFVAYSGMRRAEAQAATWEDIQGQRLKVHGTKSESSDRIIPIVPALAKLLDQMRARRAALGLPLTGRILLVDRCLDPLRGACRRLGLPLLTQHDLRHYFATICIESGVDIPTVSRWLGHGDGGALAMKTYGHLRDEHSLAAAQKVNFDSAPTATAAG